MILLDTSGILAWLDGRQRHHSAIVKAMAHHTRQSPYLLSPFVLAELDYLLATRIGREAQVAFLGEVQRGAYQLVELDAAAIASALGVMETYQDLDIGLADASLVVLAERYSVDELLTLDERHFRVLRASHGKPFRLIPADA